jgi:hypothetical protein
MRSTIDSCVQADELQEMLRPHCFQDDDAVDYNSVYTRAEV